jgi:hypothetical protein
VEVEEVEMEVDVRGWRWEVKWERWER